MPAQGCDGPEIENARVERKRLADAALVAGHSRAQHRQPGVAQPIRGQVLGRRDFPFSAAVARDGIRRAQRLAIATVRLPRFPR